MVEVFSLFLKRWNLTSNHFLVSLGPQIDLLLTGFLLGGSMFMIYCSMLYCSTSVVKVYDTMLKKFESVYNRAQKVIYGLQEDNNVALFRSIIKKD